MDDLMLDIETLGNRPTSVITQIGACYFDRETGGVGENFLVNINVGTALLAGLTVDRDTIDWWNTQENKSWIVGDCKLDKALNKFNDFANRAKYIWSHSTFDIPILMNAYKALDKKLPFHYRVTRDIRTLTHLAKHQRNESSADSKDKTHNALDDCIYQVKYCTECFNKLKELIK